MRILSSFGLLLFLLHVAGSHADCILQNSVANVIKLEKKVTEVKERIDCHPDPASEFNLPSDGL